MRLMERQAVLKKLEEVAVPDSLRLWTSETVKPETITWDEVARQIFDLYLLPDETWSLFQELRKQNYSLDRFMQEAEAFKALNSKEKVRAYFEVELLQNQDPYQMLSKIDMPGAGIRGFYNRLLRIANLNNLRKEERENALALLGYWEEAALEVICNPEAYYTKTALGNAETISEFLGSSIVFDVQMRESPNFSDGRYTEQLVAALDYDGIVDGAYIRADFNPFFRQEMLMHLVYESQGPENRLRLEFWQPIERNEDFVFISHEIAVKEGFAHSDDLLLQAVNYAWRKANDGVFSYEWTIHSILDDHFEGRTAADKFLALPEMKFKEKFDSRRKLITDRILRDYQQISDDRADMMVLLDCSRSNNVVVAKFAVVGQSYYEATARIDMNSKIVKDISEEEAVALLTLVSNFEEFKQAYLEKLSEN